MSNKYLEASKKIAIAALNEAHGNHGVEKIMDCNFCTSLAAEMTIARYYESDIQDLAETKVKLAKAIAYITHSVITFKRIKEIYSDYETFIRASDAEKTGQNILAEINDNPD